MNKKRNNGFTLIELLAVIVILAIIALIATPIILGVIEDSKKKAFENTAYGLIESAKQTIARTQLTDPSVSEASYLFKDGVVTGTPALEFSGEVPQNGALKIYANGNSSIAISNGKYCVKKTYFQEKLIMEDYIAGECNLEYTEATLNGADPVLTSGMIPIYFDGTVAKKADVSKAWYNYTAKEWANIVLVTEASREKYQNMKYGGIIIESDILAYFVWIPRYKYQLFNVTATPGSPVEIQIVFENNDTAKTLGTAKGEWRTHPAFTFGTEELNGIWVGKFELTGTASSPTVLPNVASLRSQSIASFFTISQLLNTGTYGLTNTNDSHMMKNSEWGAISYLSHSKYGINTEVRINNSSTYTTGCAASVANGSAYVGCQNAYNTTTGYLASTTGNITGIYDISGGVYEFVMGNLNKTVASSEIDFDKIDQKYYDLYTSTTSTTACNGGICYGHGLSETVGWNGDAASFVFASYPWFGRGGNYGIGASAGAFYFYSPSGGAGSSCGSRVVVLGK